MTISEKNPLLEASANTFNDGSFDSNHNRNSNGNGKWCGNAWGYNVYYSESSSINITLKLFKLVQQQQQFIPTTNNNNFSFRLTYKFLKRTDAKLR